MYAKRFTPEIQLVCSKKHPLRKYSSTLTLGISRVIRGEVRVHFDISCVLVLFTDICGQWNGHGAYPWLALIYANNDTLLGMGTIIFKNFLIMEDTGVE